MEAIVVTCLKVIAFIIIAIAILYISSENNHVR